LVKIEQLSVGAPETTCEDLNRGLALIGHSMQICIHYLEGHQTNASNFALELAVAGLVCLIVPGSLIGRYLSMDHCRNPSHSISTTPGLLHLMQGYVYSPVKLFSKWLIQAGLSAVAQPLGKRSRSVCGVENRPLNSIGCALPVTSKRFSANVHYEDSHDFIPTPTERPG